MAFPPGETDACGSVTHFFGQLREGDSLAAHQLWSRYFPRIVALAQKTLQGKRFGMSDGEDAAQSAFASFCFRVRGGEFQINDRDELWKLLGVITVNKARMQVRHEHAKKRGNGKLVNEAALQHRDGTAFTLDQLGEQLNVADFDLHTEELLQQLDPELRMYALLRLLGHSNKEIATLQDCTERKVERKLNLIRLRWQREWNGGN